MASRWPYLPRFLAAPISVSTSAGVRYSRGRRSAFRCRAGGAAGSPTTRKVGRLAACRSLAIRTVPFSVLGMFSLSRSEAAGTLASRGSTVPFPTQNGTLPIREQETSCLTKGCLTGPRPSYPALTISPRYALRPSRARPARKAVVTWGRVGGGVEGRRPAGSYVLLPARARFCEKVNDRKSLAGARCQGRSWPHSSAVLQTRPAEPSPCGARRATVARRRQGPRILCPC